MPLNPAAPRRPFRCYDPAMSVLHDIFPANIVASPSSSSPLSAPTSRAPFASTPKRVFITSTHIYVYVDAPAPNGPELAYSAPYESSSLVRSRHGVALRTASTDIVVTRAKGCGCGSALKSFRPAIASSLEAVSRACC